MYEIFKNELSLEIEAYLSAVKIRGEEAEKEEEKNIEQLNNTVLHRS